MFELASHSAAIYIFIDNLIHQQHQTISVICSNRNLISLKNLRQHMAFCQFFRPITNRSWETSPLHVRCRQWHWLMLKGWPVRLIKKICDQDYEKQSSPTKWAPSRMQYGFVHPPASFPKTCWLLQPPANQPSEVGNILDHSFMW